MPRKITIDDTVNMTDQEKLDLAQQLWDSITPEVLAADVPPGELELIEKRWQEHERNPSATVPWEEVKRQVMGK
jgi:putative addiction module component (TIGR02574 family)